MKRLCKLLATIACCTAIASAQTIDLSWYTIDGGGTTFSIGGNLQLGSTIGQADASNPMTGGAWSLAGGFWPGASDVGAPPCPGDLDNDRQVSISDLAILLSHFGITGTAQPADGDLDGDHGVDISDLSTLLSRFGSVCP